MMRLILMIVMMAALPAGAASGQDSSETRRPLRLGIVGLVHGHVEGFLHESLARPDVELVGVYEPDDSLAAAYAARYGVDAARMYAELERLLEEARPDAVAIFTNTFDHPAVVEAAARRGVHAMMEKPLAVSMAHARRIEEAARAGGIHVLVNYETTWYPNTAETYRLAVEEGALGALRKIVVHDGHPGPKEIGVSPEFLGWLTDPVLNGGGALTDFGCYGADLITWLLGGQRPLAVTAVLQQLKTDPDYARVDDEATILLTYPAAQGVIQASWNWTFHRKDMEVYGDSAAVLTLDRERYRLRDLDAETVVTAAPLPAPHADPLSYLAAVVRGEARPSGLSSLPVNVIVTEILDAARRSAETGRTVRLDE